MVLAFSKLRTPGFHVISIVAFPRRADIELFPESWEFNDRFFVFLLGLGCSLFASLPLSRRFGPRHYTLDGDDRKSYSSWFWLGITKGVMTVRIVLRVHVGLYVVHLDDGWCFPSV